MWEFVCALQGESLFLRVLWKSCNQILLAFKVSPWEFPVPLLDLQAGKPDMGLRSFTTVWELLLYYCSPVCGSPNWQVSDLILLWLCPSYHLVMASSLSLDIGLCFFGGFQCPHVNDCSTDRSNSGALARGDEHTFFCSAILNWKSCVSSS